MSIFSKLFKSKKDKDFLKLQPILKLVNEEEVWAKSLKDEEFPIKTQELRESAKTTSLDKLLPKAFALAREAAFRVLNERHYDVQIMGAIVLHRASILEMKTGEGKTLTCVPAAYLNSLNGSKVHIVTVNDYLAERDSKWMGRVFNFLGLSVGCILSSMDNENRREAYSADITYGTNNEFGFDYLRDNMKWDYKEKIQAEHNYCIIDEIDSILIDEARTPLIISGSSVDDSQNVIIANMICTKLVECEKNPQTNDYYEQNAFDRFDKKVEFDEKGDYKIDEKRKKISFTKEGYLHMEELLSAANVIKGSLYDGSNFELVHYITQAVCAHRLYQRDTDYIVRDEKVEIVDEFTGRVLEGRRYSDGLHQAIEAKERIKILGKNRTLATITFQNFFRMYDKLSGMTGTADTEAGEFLNIYNLDVVVIPTNKEMLRRDEEDVVYYNEEQKHQAIIDEIKRVHETGQPILVGTASIEKSEIISALLKRAGIKHEILNAKNHHREALIIENAGSLNSVTISTNMAGRGTDIKLGGSLNSMARKLLSSTATDKEIQDKEIEVKDKWRAQYEQVKALGGLYILGTERHESRRIDNQLRGRSGRQGDPGISRFYLSLDDNLIRLFASERMRGLLGRVGMKDGEPLVFPMLSRGIEKAQKRVEDQNFEIRKHLLEYDNVLNEQRNYIYKQRDEILLSEDLVSRVIEIAIDWMSEDIDEIFETGFDNDDDLLFKLQEGLIDKYRINFNLNDFNKLKKDEIVKVLSEKFRLEIQKKVDLVGLPDFNTFLRYHYLKQVDNRWQDHLENLEALREAVYLRSYAQKNPLNEYKNEGFELFDQMIVAVRNYVARTLINVNVVEDKKAEEVNPLANISAQHKSANEHVDNAQVVRVGKKVGRNDPCPCGSGKKYKHCHGRL